MGFLPAIAAIVTTSKGMNFYRCAEACHWLTVRGQFKHTVHIHGFEGKRTFMNEHSHINTNDKYS